MPEATLWFVYFSDGDSCLRLGLDSHLQAHTVTQRISSLMRPVLRRLENESTWTRNLRYVKKLYFILWGVFLGFDCIV